MHIINQFTQVRAGEDTTNLLRERDDPTGKAKALGKQWIVRDRVAFGRQLNGKIISCSRMIIRPGDFVDVSATAEIDVKRKDTGALDVRVNFSLKRVIQLKAAAVSYTVSTSIIDIILD